MIATLAPLLGGFFFVLSLGAALRQRGGPGFSQGNAAADVLGRVIVDVTMPALLVHVLAAQDLEWSASSALLATTAAFVASAVIGTGLARVLGQDRRAQGAAGLTASFCNTGFLGFPLMLALFPGDGAASSAALLVDTFNTTLLLWTLGAGFATRMGRGGELDVKTSLRMLVRPMTLAVLLGLALRTAGITIPPFLDGTLAALGACTSPLVFLTLGIQLDVAALRGRLVSLGATTVVKLLLSPLLCLLVVRTLRLPEPVASVAVLQAGMPSAMASVIVAADSGCERAYAAGAATLSTIGCLLSLPLVGWLLDLTR